MTGTSTSTLIGTIHAGDAVTQGEKNDLVTACDSVAAQATVGDLRRPRRPDPGAGV